MPSLRQLMAMGVAALSLSGGGCALLADGTCVACYRLREAVGDCAETHRNYKWAEQAWANVRRCYPQVNYSEDYAAGFRDGFSEYLYRGGNGEPPPLPPKHYRHVSYQTPGGYKSIEDWFAGYRHGATAAREGGYRQYVTGPSSVQTLQPAASVVEVHPTSEPPPPVETPRQPSSLPPVVPAQAPITGAPVMPEAIPASAPAPVILPPEDVYPPESQPTRARITAVRVVPESRRPADSVLDLRPAPPSAGSAASPEPAGPPLELLRTPSPAGAATDPQPPEESSAARPARARITAVRALPESPNARPER
jgi:hypothetical protein